MVSRSLFLKTIKLFGLSVFAIVFIGFNSFLTKPASDTYRDPSLISNSDFQGFCSGVQHDRDNSLSISFQATWLDSTSPNQNLFQTAPLNDGFRIELDTQGSPNLVASLRAGTIDFIPGESRLLLGRTTQIFLQWEKRSKVTLVVGNSSNTSVWDFQREIRCDDFRTALGYDSSRVFKGEISNMEIEFRYREPLLKIHALIKFLFGIVLGTGLLFALIPRNIATERIE
jgi:hypothetical protein